MCVNQYGERIYTNVLGSDVHNVYILIAIVSESYDSIVKVFQSEIAETVADIHGVVTANSLLEKSLRI